MRRKKLRNGERLKKNWVTETERKESKRMSKTERERNFKGEWDIDRVRDSI